MPPLSSLSINQPGVHPGPGPGYGYAPPPGAFSSPRNMQGQPVGRAPAVHSPAEAHIQSWADNVAPQQPKPTQPIQQMWAPEMGIKFTQSPGPGAGQGTGRGGSGSGGTWDPNAGIRFG